MHIGGDLIILLSPVSQSTAYGQVHSGYEKSFL